MLPVVNSAHHHQHYTAPQGPPVGWTAVMFWLHLRAGLMQSLWLRCCGTRLMAASQQQQVQQPQ
jgi:hypothetical protein